MSAGNHFTPGLRLAFQTFARLPFSPALFPPQQMLFEMQQMRRPLPEADFFDTDLAAVRPAPLAAGKASVPGSPSSVPPRSAAILFVHWHPILSFVININMT